MVIMKNHAVHANSSRVFPVATLILFLINTIIYFCLAKANSAVFAKQYQFGALLFPHDLLTGQWYRLISCLFVHEDLGHYLSNTILFIFCIYVERNLGSLRFLFYYFISGFFSTLFGSGIIFLFHLVPFPEMVILGASGALFGIVGVFVSIFLKRAQDGGAGIDKWLGLIFLLIAFGDLVRGAAYFPCTMWFHLTGFCVGLSAFFVINLFNDRFCNARQQLILLSIIYVPLVAIACSTIFYEIKSPVEITALQAGNTGNIYDYLNDEDNASKWYLVSAEKGDANGQAEVARRYYIGLGFEKNYTKTFFWAIKAASQNNVWAQTLLSQSYCEGEGVQADHEKCLFWLEKAARQGDLQSQWSLAGRYFENRDNSPGDMKISYYWCSVFLKNPESQLKKNEHLKEQIIEIKQEIEQQFR